MINPFLKWAGGKMRMVPALLPYFNQNVDTFVEPFCGAGAAWLNVDYKKYIVADINPDLINLFECLKKEGPDFVDYCSTYFVQSNDLSTYRYNRVTFNTTTDIRKKSALFVYLNRHCFNGLCRYNASGYFNVPFGKHDKVYFPKSEMLSFAEKAQKAEFLCIDFVKLFDQIKDLDCMIYCDPPYVPASATSNFTSYSKNGFGSDRQFELLKCILSTKSRVVVSNSMSAKEMYKDLEIVEVDVRRSISASDKSRKMVKDIIGIKYEQ